MATPYPLSGFHFKVEWGGASGAFTEVSGLNLEHQVIEYRDGLSPIFSTIKIFSGYFHDFRFFLKKKSTLRIFLYLDVCIP